MSFLRRFAAGTAVVAVAVLASAPAASAHDQLLDSAPGIDEQLDTAPERIEMRFSGQLLTLGDTTAGAVVLVVDASGHDWATGEVEVAGDTVTATVEPEMPEAGYQVRWQVISEDGHPIAGVVPFTVGDAAPFVLDEPVAPGDLSAGDPAAQAQTAQESGDALRMLTIGAGGAAAAGAVFALILLFRRRSATAPASSSEADDTRKNTP